MNAMLWYKSVKRITILHRTKEVSVKLWIHMFSFVGQSGKSLGGQVLSHSKQKKTRSKKLQKQEVSTQVSLLWRQELTRDGAFL